MRVKEMFRKITKKNPKPDNRERFLASINELIIQFWKDWIVLRDLRKPQTDLNYFKIFDELNQKGNALKHRLRAFYGMEVISLNLFSEILKQNAPEAYAGYMEYRKKNITNRITKDLEALGTEEEAPAIKEGSEELKLVK